MNKPQRRGKMVEQNVSLPTTKKAPRHYAVPLIPLLLGLLMIAVIGLFAYLTQDDVSNSRNWLLHTYDVRSELQNLETQLAEIRGSALAFAGSGDESQLRLFRQHADGIANLTEGLRKLTADNPRQQYRLGELESLSKKYVAQLEKRAISAAPRTLIPPGEAASIRNLDSQESQLDAVVRSMAGDEKMLLDDRLATWNRLFRRNAVILAMLFQPR